MQTDSDGPVGSPRRLRVTFEITVHDDAAVSWWPKCNGWTLRDGRGRDLVSVAAIGPALVYLPEPDELAGVRA